jgi:hypothetical protein
MQIANQLRGFNYPTFKTERCPKFHRCIVTSKCQNFDRHSNICQNCESRVRPPIGIGGLLPEGELEPDVQEAVKTIQRILNRPMMHPDVDQSLEINQNMINAKKLEESNKVIEEWTNKNSIIDQDVVVSVDEKYGEMLSDLVL